MMYPTLRSLSAGLLTLAVGVLLIGRVGLVGAGGLLVSGIALGVPALLVPVGIVLHISPPSGDGSRFPDAAAVKKQ